ncbi:MAG: hypothetical protein WBN39_15475 [Flavobacteriaceae bacterium]
MNRRIKLIWDFKGPMAGKTAEHHEKHLKEYIRSEQLPLQITGHRHLGEMHSLAFMVVDEGDMIKVRDVLKPHRGELHQELDPLK